MERGNAIAVAEPADWLAASWDVEGKMVWQRRWRPRSTARVGIPADRTEQVYWWLEQGLLDLYDRIVSWQALIDDAMLPATVGTASQPEPS
jgi:hypothetical protein